MLKLFNANRKKFLKPEQQEIYNVITSLKNTVKRVTARKSNITERLREAENYIKRNSLDSLDKMPVLAKQFFISQLRNASKHKFGRTYTFSDKAFALALYKKSPKAYRYLAQVFYLPSKEILRKLIKEIKIKPGICDVIFEEMKARVASFDDDKDKYCILMFDEMKLDASLEYNVAGNIVEGFTDDGYDRKMEIADHVLVWMIKGVYSAQPWKQPIAFSFNKNMTLSEIIVRTYKDIVTRVHDVGLEIVASICDQGSSNVKAVQHLILQSKQEALRNNNNWKHDVIIINGQQIIPLYDPPHLLKCMRNNLLTKDLKFKLDDGKVRIAKWSHIEDAYEIDCSYGHLRTMTKLTDLHIVKNKIKKMKVSYCAQVFSRTVSTIISLMSKSQSSSSTSNKCMPSEGVDTAELLYFFNELFDSINGNVKLENNEHEELWLEGIKVIKSMEFIKRRPHDKKVPQVLKSWIHTLEGFRLLSRHLFDINFTIFRTKNFNQDPVENFFGQIRQYGIRNTNPTCSTFLGYYKSLLINTYTQIASKCENCEQDETCGFLITFNKFLQFASSEEEQFIMPQINLKEIPIIDDITFYNVKYMPHSKIQKITSLYTKNCEICHGNVDKLQQHNNNIVKKMVRMIHTYLPVISHLPYFTKFIKEYLMECIDVEFVECDHAALLKEILISKYVDWIVTNYFVVVKSILKDVLHFNDGDFLMQTAENYFKKYNSRDRN